MSLQFFEYFSSTITGNNSLVPAVERAFLDLSAKEQFILVQRFVHNRTYKSIGDELGGVSKQYIEQTKNNAINKIKRRLSITK